MTNKTTTPDLINLPSITRDDASLLTDALTSLYHSVDTFRTKSQMAAVQAVQDGLPATAVAYDTQAVVYGQRLNAILNLAYKLGVGIEGDE